MRSPVLVTPPASLPVTLDEAKLHLRVDGADDDALIDGLLQAAVSHLDGWTGVLGRCLSTQNWRMDFDAFSRCMRLPLGPANDIVSITWRNAAGQLATIDDSNYLLRSDATGAFVHWDRSFSFPTGLYDGDAVSVTYSAGYSSIPSAIKQAILLLIAHWYDNRETATLGSPAEWPFAVGALLSPFKIWRV